MPAGSTSAIDWTQIKFNWRGEWSSGGVYSKNDIVRFNGRTFYCLTDQLYDQNLTGPEYGPGKILQGSQEYNRGEISTVNWAISNTSLVYAVSNQQGNPNLDNPSASNLYGSFQAIPTKSSAWDTAVYSRESYTNGAMASAMVAQTNAPVMFGLCTSPTSSSSYTNLDYAWYFVADGTLQIYESGGMIASYGSYTKSTKLSIKYDGQYIRYYKDNNVVRQIDKGWNLTFFFSSSIYSPSAILCNMSFGSGINNKYWAEHTDGYLYRGTWFPYRNYYEGDIVRLRNDIYMCLRDNYNGHPIYKNGHKPTNSYPTEPPNPDWKKIMSGTHANDDKYVECLANCPPLGWTRYRGSWMNCGSQPNSGRGRYFSASGRAHYTGWQQGVASGVSGEQGQGGLAPAINMTFDHADFKYGRLPTYQTGTSNTPKCIQIVGCENWAMALFDNGELYHWGSGGYGETGNGTTNDSYYPVRPGYVIGTHDWRASGTGAGSLATTRIIKIGNACVREDTGTHSPMVLDENGNVWMWGYNGYGQLGQGDFLNRSTPTQINSAYFENVPIVDIWTNGGEPYTSCYAIDANGDLYAWGYNGYGQLGTGGVRYEPAPVKVNYNWHRYGGIKKFYAYAYASYGACSVLTNDGTLHSCGRMYYNSIGAPGMGGTNATWNASFRPYPDLIKGWEQREGNPIRNKGTQLNVLRNIDDMWVLGHYPGDNTHFVFKEKHTGLLYGMGWNPYNCLLQTPNSWIKNATDTYFDRTHFPFPMDLNAPDLCFIGIAMINSGSSELFYVTETGKVVSAGTNENGCGGYGVSGTGNNHDSFGSYYDYDISSMLTSSGRTWIGVRQAERFGIVGGLHGAATGSAWFTSESGTLYHTGYQNYAPLAGQNIWDSQYAYGGRTGLQDNYHPIRVYN